jgi:CYRIA/CYRIB Rac1 binding domain
MTTPAIQNDFSYYRRMMSRQSLSSSEAGGATIAGEEPVDSYLASRMSMFYAQPTPMLSVLSEAMTKFLSNVIHR